MCDYCKDIGACPKCWGRGAIDVLKAENAELLAALKECEDLLHRLGVAYNVATAAIVKAERNG